MGLGLGNAISFLCNLLAWRLGARLRWLRIVLIIQALPTIAFAAVACKAVWDNWQDRRSLQQRSAIWNAVRPADERDNGTRPPSGQPPDRTRRDGQRQSDRALYGPAHLRRPVPAG
ncbi:hypothetical protein G6F35_017859 [Rhizopus arrhizus]|nr:hypothetical protein G6F35_017859 [Rhizopus arrhizus]